MPEPRIDAKCCNNKSCYPNHGPDDFSVREASVVPTFYDDNGRRSDDYGYGRGVDSGDWDTISFSTIDLWIGERESDNGGTHKAAYMRNKFHD